MNQLFQHVFDEHIRIKDEEDVEHHDERHVTKKKSHRKKNLNIYFISCLAVDQRQLYFNSEHNSNNHLSPSSSYRRATGLMKGYIYYNNNKKKPFRLLL